jgi:hypothetical protein
MNDVILHAYRESKTMMMNTEERFAEAENSWDLERLYTDLGKAKGKSLTAKEKLYLRGLLCGYGPAEMARKCHKSPNGLKVHLSKTLYQYVKVLVNKENDKLENWTNIREWLEEIGYKRSSLDDKNVFNLTCDNNSQAQTTQGQNQKIDNWFNSSPIEQVKCKHELEKAQLMIEQQQKEIDYLKQQVSDLREIIGFLKKAKKSEE